MEETRIQAEAPAARPFRVSLLLAATSAAGGIAVPLALAPLIGITPAKAALVVGTALLVEYGASAEAALLTLPPSYSVLAPTWVAAGIILAQLFLFDAFSSGTGRVAAFLTWARDWGTRSFFHRYGIVGLVPGIWVAGFYVCPAMAWVFGWKRLPAFLLMIGAYSLAALLSWAAATGLLSTIFPLAPG